MREVRAGGGGWCSETVDFFRAIGATLGASVCISSFCLGLGGYILVEEGEGGGVIDNRGLVVLGVNSGG